MAEITASMVKDLREKTGAGMMECKKALEKSNGDFEGAVKVLRESGAAKAAKRESRTAAEGLVYIAHNANHTVASLAELNCETDFVSRNDEFQKLVKTLAETALATKSQNAEELSAKPLPGYGRTAGEAVQDLLAKIGEKIVLNRAATLEGDIVAGYIHPPGKIGVLVAAKLNGAKATDELAETLRGIAMHIAAANPRFLSEDQVDAKTLDAERDIYANIARKEGKKEELIPKIVEGKVRAFYKEACLVSQAYVRDPNQSITKVLEVAGKAAGGAVELTRFVRVQVGEGAGAAPAAE